MPNPSPDPDELLFEGRFLSLHKKTGRNWEYAARKYCKGIVGILAVTDRREIVLTEQFRPAVTKRVFELPAGLAGDDPLKPDEPFLSAAKRELLEETGFEARKWWSLLDGPSSAGLTDETITIFLATGLVRVAERDTHGVEGESIKVHLVPVAEVLDFLRRQQEDGAAVDFKIFASLYVAARHPMSPF